MFRKSFLAVFVALGTIALAAGSAHAQQIVAYDNVTTFGGQAFANGGATLQGANTITNLIADDLNYSPGLAGLSITSLSFNVANFNTAAVSARPLIRLWNNDGTGGLPGTLLAAINFNAISFVAGSVQTFTGTLPLSFVALPSSGTIWAGITFDNNSGATGATAAQLNNLGMGIFNPPTVGSSLDRFFITSAAGSFATNNPAGSSTSFGGTPPANFGFRVVVSVPEPGTFALAAVGAVLPLAAAVRRRRKSNKIA